MQHQTIKPADIALMIDIENLTDEKLYKVCLFEPFTELNKKLRYSLPIDSDKDYSLFLSNLINGTSQKKLSFNEVRVHSYCAFDKFRARQAECAFTIRDEGSTAQGKLFIDLYQMQSNIGSCRLYDRDRIVSPELQLTLDFLLPETRVTIILAHTKD